MVSEFMLQQTPVARVLPGLRDAGWRRWPTPGGAGRRAERRGGAGLGTARLPAPGAAPARGRHRDRRAARRRGAGVVRRPASRCPASATTPRARSRRSPSAAATSCSTPTCAGCSRGPSAASSSPPPRSPGPSATLAESLRARRADRATWAVAVMELGALVCTAANPRCAGLPGRATGAPGRRPARPAYDGPPRRGQAWAGTDRQVPRPADGRAARRRGQRRPRRGSTPPGPSRRSASVPCRA